MNIAMCDVCTKFYFEIDTQSESVSFGESRMLLLYARKHFSISALGIHVIVYCHKQMLLLHYFHGSF